MQKKCAVLIPRIGAEVSTHKKHSSQGGHYERKIKYLGEMVGEETTILNVFSPSTSTSHFEEKPSLLSIVLEQLDLESLLDLAQWLA